MIEEKRPVGRILVHDPRGYAYIPKIVRSEIGLEGIGEISFYLDANCVLLVREGASRNEVLKGLEVLKADLKLRMKRTTE